MDDRPDLDALRRAAEQVAAEWGVELGPPFALSRYSYVAPAGGDAVLKVTPAEDDESDHEADALALWHGEGAVRLLRHDRGRRALLLERAQPGHDASELPDDQATAIGVATGMRLWRPVERGRPYRSIRDEVPRWLAHPDARSHPLAGEAQRTLAAMQIDDSTLVHGDFHHHNLLRGDVRWLAIDPKPYAGEPEYDVPSFLWNPLPYRMTPELTERRIAAFVAAGLDDRKIREWTLVRGAYLGADEDEIEVIRGLF